MKTSNVPVDVFITIAFCEDCKQEMRRDGTSTLSWETKHKYVCDGCKKVELSPTSYPRTSFSVRKKTEKKS